MNKIQRAHCLFEQSGTFKREFVKLGIPAEDYDILNDFGETDHIVDLWDNIDKAYRGGASLFDNISKDDLIMAFFPCTRFETRVYLNARGENGGMKKWDLIQKLEYSRKTFGEINENYQRICKLVIVAIKRGFKLIIENPNTKPHILTDFFPIKPLWIDTNRRLRGDNFIKPTQYWFINCEPRHNFIWEPQEEIEAKTIEKTYNQVERSCITSIYANRFIREFIINW